MSSVPYVLMSGPPGSGKTLMARALPAILPLLTNEGALDATRIYSVADQLPPDVPLIRSRPFRAPHHTISYAGLVGAGIIRTRARSRWHTAEFSSRMNCPNSSSAFWKCCASHRRKIRDHKLYFWIDVYPG